MTKLEYSQIKLYIDGSYNNFKINDIVWYDFLKDYDYKLTLQAVKNVIKVSKYPLTIASITEEYEKLKDQKEREDYVFLDEVAEEMMHLGHLTESEFEKFDLDWRYENVVNPIIKKKILHYVNNSNYKERVLEILGGTSEEKKLLN